MEKRLDTELGEGGGRLGSWASLLPPSFAGGANFKSLVRLPPAQPQPPCRSPSGEAFGWGWLGLEPDLERFPHPHLRTPGSCWRLTGGREGGPDPERPMVSSFGPREGTPWPRGWELGAGTAPEGCLILGAPPTGQDRLGKSPLGGCGAWPACSGRRCRAEPFPAVLGAGSRRLG